MNARNQRCNTYRGRVVKVSTLLQETTHTLEFRFALALRRFVLVQDLRLSLKKKMRDMSV